MHEDPRHARMGQQIYAALTGAGFDIDMFDARGNITQASEEATRFWSDELKTMTVFGGTTGGSAPKPVVTFNISDITVGDPDLFRKFNEVRRLIVKGNNEDFSFRVHRFGRTLTKRNFKHLNTTHSVHEGYEWTGSTRTSRLPVDGVMVVIRHTRPWDRDNMERAQRWRRIRSIMLHTPDGQRVQFPYHNLRGARAMAQHLNQGFAAHDEHGKMIQDLTKLSMDLQSIQRKCRHRNAPELGNNIKNTREQIHVLLECLADSALYENTIEDAKEWGNHWKRGEAKPDVNQKAPKEDFQDFREGRELENWLRSFDVSLTEDDNTTTPDDVEQVRSAMNTAKDTDGDKYTAFDALKNDTDSGWGSEFDADPKRATEKFDAILKKLEKDE